MHLLQGQKRQRRRNRHKDKTRATRFKKKTNKQTQNCKNSKKKINLYLPHFEELLESVGKKFLMDHKVFWYLMRFTFNPPLSENPLFCLRLRLQRVNKVVLLVCGHEKELANYRLEQEKHK